jgi:hypothetical protein
LNAQTNILSNSWHAFLNSIQCLTDKLSLKNKNY